MPSTPRPAIIIVEGSGVGTVLLKSALKEPPPVPKVMTSLLIHRK